MALMVDVEEGTTTTGSQSEEDDIYVKSLRTTLKEANLTKILDAFEKESMTAKDLIYYCTKDDIQDMITQDINENSPEVKISTKDKIKFIRIVMTIQQKLKEQQSAQAESKQDSADSHSDLMYLKRMLELNADNKVEVKRIVEFMENHKDIPFQRIFEIVEEKDNHLDLHAVFDIFQFCKDNNIDANRMIGHNYPDLVRLFQLNHDHTIASHRIITFIHRNSESIEMQNVYQCIDDDKNAYGVNLKEIFAMFDYGHANAIDLNRIFGVSYPDLKRLFQYKKRKKVTSRTLQRSMVFIDKAKGIDLQRVWDIMDDKLILDLKAVLDLFNPELVEIDLQSMFGKKYDYLQRLFTLGREQNISKGRIVRFVNKAKNLNFEVVFELMEENIETKEIFDMFDYGYSNGIDVFSANYADLKRLFEYKKSKKVNSRHLQRIMVFMDKTKDVDLQRLWDVIDDKRYKLDLKAASDLFDPDEIDLESMFGKNYGYLTRLFTLRRGHGHNISNKRIVKFANKVKDVNFEAIFELIEDDGNEIDLKVIFEFVNANTTKDTDFKRLFEVGSEAIPAWVKINECKQSRSRTVDKENIKQKVCVNADKVQKQLNEECEWMINQINTMKKTTAARIEFEKNLYIEHVTKYTSPTQDADVFRDTFLKCLSNTSQSIAATNKQLQQLHGKAVASSKKRSLSTSPLSVWCSKGKLKDIINFSGSSVNVALKPLTLKCPSVNGNIVTLDWGPTKPWEDKDNYVLSKLHELNQMKMTNCAYVVQYSECEIEQKHENDDDVYVNWMGIDFKLRKKDSEWREQCEMFLDNNKTYKFRIQYSYSGYGTSEFSNIITVQTSEETPITKGIDKYEAVFSDKFRSKNMELKGNNTLAQSIAKNSDSQCIRAKNEVMKGTKIMLEFVSKSGRWDHSCWGVVRRNTTNKSENDMHEFTSESINGIYGITSSSPHVNGMYWSIVSYSYWIQGFSDSGINNIKLVIDWTADRCSLLYIVNGLILYRGKEERYSVKLDKLTDDEHLYPCILLKDKETVCQIKSVEV
eukprot:257350_1